MEARTILLTSLVLALWTSTTKGATSNFCNGKVDGPYCEHCLQPVQCTGGVTTTSPLCGSGTACIVNSGASFCVPHTSTDCACTTPGDQCDAYNPGYIDHCLTSGPFLVDACLSGTPICYNSQCVAYPQCPINSWSMTSDCTGAFFCDNNGLIQGGFECNDGEYVNSNYVCSTDPLLACDGSCSGNCPDPVDCTKFYICAGTTAVGSGTCPASEFFDIGTNSCMSAGYVCTLWDGCNIEIGLGQTTSTGQPASTYTVPPDLTCSSSTVGDKFPYGPCSKQYYVCAEQPDGQYEYILTECLGDLFFSTDPDNPYCIDTCL